MIELTVCRNVRGSLAVVRGHLVEPELPQSSASHAVPMAGHFNGYYQLFGSRIIER